MSSVKIPVVGGWGVVVGALAWLCCSCSSTELVSELDAGGSDASTGGSGGTGGVGGSGGVGGTGGVGGSGGVGGVGGTGGSAGTAGTGGSDGGIPDGSPDGMAGSGGDAAVDAPPDVAACLNFGEACDPAADACCDLLFCDGAMGAPRCRPQADDGGPVCAAPNQPCTTTDCCPGLVCEPSGPTELCRFEALDGGPHDSGVPDALACMDLYEPCGGGVGTNCCVGLECKKLPPAFPERACLPIDPPDPSTCPPQAPTPGQDCSVVGLQCSYGVMTVCTCFSTGWMCAY